jgi:hypothetical protein
VDTVTSMMICYNSSFGDYSSLIGDDTTLIDQQLLAAPKVDGSDLQSSLDKLISLSKKQKKCGLEEVSESDAASILELFQQVLAKIDPALVEYEIGDIKMKLNGTWKLLYTNSEMFKVCYIILMKLLLAVVVFVLLLLLLLSIIIIFIIIIIITIIIIISSSSSSSSI